MSIIDKLVDHVGMRKLFVIRYIVELGEFYIRPIKFFEKYFIQSIPDKIFEIVLT
jgi:hypothetical protein